MIDKNYYLSLFKQKLFQKLKPFNVLLDIIYIKCIFPTLVVKKTKIVFNTRSAPCINMYNMMYKRCNIIENNVHHLWTKFVCTLVFCRISGHRCLSCLKPRFCENTHCSPLSYWDTYLNPLILHIIWHKSTLLLVCHVELIFHKLNANE